MALVDVIIILPTYLQITRRAISSTQHSLLLLFAQNHVFDPNEFKQTNRQMKIKREPANLKKDDPVPIH